MHLKCMSWCPMMTGTSPSLAITDVPLGGLPSADKTLLANAPLEVAIIEVRFTSALAEVPADVASSVRDALAKAVEVDFPSIQPATQGTMQINFSAGGAAWSGDETKGWQVASGSTACSPRPPRTASTARPIFPSSIIWQEHAGAARSAAERRYEGSYAFAGSAHRSAVRRPFRRSGVQDARRLVRKDRRHPVGSGRQLRLRVHGAPSTAAG